MKEKLFLKRKAVRITLWVVCLVGILFIATQIFVSRYLPGIIRNRITYLVVNGSDSLYKCSIGKVSVSLFGGIVTTDHIDISVDSAKFNKMKQRGQLPDVTFSIKLTEGRISGFKIFSFLIDKKIRINTIRASNPDITIHSQYNPQKEKIRKMMKEKEKQEREHRGLPDEPISEQKLWELIEPRIPGIYIHSIYLDHMKFSYQKAGTQRAMKIEYDDLSASLKEIRIDSVGAAEQDRILFTEDLSIYFTGLKYCSEDSLYTVHMDSMVYSSYTKNIFVKGFGVGPTLTPLEFTRKVGQQVDVFDVTIPEICITHFQIDKFFTENAICIDTVGVRKPLLKIYHDRTFSPDTVVKYGQYPNEALFRAPFILKIPVILLFDSEVHYIEKQAVTFRTGDGFWTHVNGVMHNVTNDSLWLTRNGHLTVDMEGYFLHSGRMKAGFDFDLASPNGHFTARADLGKMNANELNIMTIPFGNLKMHAADLREAHFRLNGNRSGTTGTLRMIYEDLQVELLTKQKKDGVFKEDKFLSFLANLVGIRKRNPAANGKETIAENISVKRTPPMPFFNMIWRTLFGGMKDIMLKGPAKKIKIGQEE